MLHLTEERTEFDAPFVVDESLREKSAAASIFENSGTQVDIFSITHRSKASQGFIDTFLYTQIETAGIKLVHLPLAAAYTARGEKRGHRIVDGLLYGCKRRMRTVRTAKGIAGFLVKLLLDNSQVVFRNDDVRVQNNEILALAALSTVVAGRART